MDKEDLDSAIKDFTSAIDKKSGDPEVYFNRGICYYGKKDYVASLRDLNKTVALNPLSAKYYYTRGIVETVTG